MVELAGVINIYFPFQLFPNGNPLYLQVKGVEQELDGDDGDAALSAQME